MPEDALSQVIAVVPEPVSFKEGDVMERWKDGFGPKEEVAAPALEVKPKEEPPVVKTGEIPPEILGVEPVKAQEPDLLNEEPKGQLKNENYKRLQAYAKTQLEAERAEKAELKKQIEANQAKLKDDYVPEGLAKRIEQYEAALKEREEELSKVAVERSSTFKERFTVRQDGLFKQLQKTAQELGLDGDLASQLVHSGGKKRFDLLEDLEINGSAKSYLTSLLQQHDQVEADKAEYLADWKTRSAELEQQTLAQQDKEKSRVKALEDKAFQDVQAEMAKKSAYLRPIEGNEEWNKTLEADIASAKAMFDGDFTPHAFAEMVLAGARAKTQGKMMDTLIEKYRAVIKENGELKAASPSTPPPGAKAPVQDDKGLTQEEQFKRTFDRIVGSAANNGMR